MNRNPLLITCLCLVGFAVGCKPSAEQGRNVTSEPIDKVKNDTKERAQAIENYTFAQKAAAVGKMKRQIAGINRDLDETNFSGKAGAK